MATSDQRQWNAYANEDVEITPAGEGLLTGKTFAVKDVFDIKGHTSGAGNPDWLRTHEPAAGHAAVIDKLLAAGARLRGTTITDELMYSINGENAHYGTPRNPKAPGRIPGGSSSGSAVAVSAGLADFAIGTDTGGSIRVPSAYCGIYGIRPTHGAVDTGGLIPLAPSFDTVGWMARDARTMLEIGCVLLGGGERNAAAAEDARLFTRFIVATDLWDVADEETRAALGLFVPGLQALVGRREDVVAAPEGLRQWVNAFRIRQGLEIWLSHGEWIKATKPSFGPGIAERFQWAAALTEEDGAAPLELQKQARSRMEALLGEDGILVMPTVPSAAPLQGRSGEGVERVRMQTFELCCAAGLGGLPQATVPVIGEGGLPIGLSFMAGRGQDLRLLEWIADKADGCIRERAKGERSL